MNIFRENDIRGIVGADLSAELVYNLGMAIGTYVETYAIAHGVKTVGTKTMILGRDCRLSSGSYHDAIKRGLNATGINVVDIGLCAVPMLYFSIRHFHADGGVMVTGSHNPPEFNGFKICVGSDTMFGGQIKELQRIFEAGWCKPGKGIVRYEDVSKVYEDYIYSRIKIKTTLKKPLNKSLNVIVDAGNGVGGLFALPLLKRFGCQVASLYCKPDGNFPNHFPDPTIPENLVELIVQVKEKEADLGIAYDGDADRLNVITDKGEILWGDELLLLFSRFVLKENPGAGIIGEVKCSQKLYDDIEKHGGRAIMWKVGHSLIKAKMKEEKALLAGEMSGHFFFADRYFGYDDAIYATARLIEILAMSGKKLSEILSDVPKSFTTPEIRIDCPDHIKFQIVEEVKLYFKKDCKIIDIDGARILFEDGDGCSYGWGLVRASNTQPVVVLRFEAATAECLYAIKRTVMGVVEKVMESFFDSQLNFFSTAEHLFNFLGGGNNAQG